MSKKLILIAIAALGMGLLANGLPVDPAFANQGGVPNGNAAGNGSAHGNNSNANGGNNDHGADPHPGRGNDTPDD